MPRVDKRQLQPPGKAEAMKAKMQEVELILFRKDQKMKKIYLATPYTGTPEQQQERFEQVNKVAAQLMANGFLVFSPISHTHPIALAGDLPKGWDFWAAHDRTFIEWCDELYVLTLNGWAESTGVTAERKLARELGKPVRYLSEKCVPIDKPSHRLRDAVVRYLSEECVPIDKPSHRLRDAVEGG